jgi:ADP-heptose:LPS heptosyltransferase
MPDTLVYITGALGDIILSTPALQAVREHCAETRVHLIAPRALGQLFPHVASTHTNVDAAHVAALFSDPAAVLQTVPAWRNVTTIVVFEAEQSALVRVLRSVPAFDVISIAVAPRDCRDEHYARFVWRKTCAALRHVRAFSVPEPAEQAPKTLPIEPFAVVHPGSGAPCKNAPPALLAAACRELEAGRQWHWLLVAGEADTAAAADFLQAWRRPIAPIERAALPEIVWYLRRAQAYVGNDSGISHLAGIAGAPGIVFFGPTDRRVWRPLSGILTIRTFRS